MDNYATHQRFLLKAALRTSGAVLELGCGWYSTPILHEICIAYGRPLVSHDNDPVWLNAISPNYKHPLHSFGKLDRVAWAEDDRHWGLVFVDHGPPPELPRNSRGLLNALDRAQAVLDLMDRTDVFVLHDTEEPVRWEYDWDKVLPLFKYQVTDKGHPVQTTILSNRIDVRIW